MKKSLTQYKQAYFLGIGGIGMSAIGRYLLSLGIPVYGYDKTETPLTQSLVKEGAVITYNDSLEAIPNVIASNLEDTLFILTPAIPKDHAQWNFFKQQKVEILKRAEVLGLISSNMFCIAVAGTHGKTTTSTLIAHLLETAGVNYTAFLGGISANYNTNYLRKTDGIDLTEKPIVVLEADEFDRSFHQLQPDIAIITAIDPDHLDIYNTHQDFKDAFNHFANLIRKSDPDFGGHLVLQEKLSIQLVRDHISIHTYGPGNQASYSFENVSIENGKFLFNFVSKHTQIDRFKCGLPGFHNVSNATAALAVCQGILGINLNLLKQGIASYKGAKRRFEFVVDTDKYVVIDDYAHHPEELNAIIGSVKSLYPTKKITGIFQPHLFTRTRDFAEGFGNSLSQLDELWLMDIYPARELPIEGITSSWLLEKVSLNQKHLMSPSAIVNQLNKQKPEVLLILGAGDIDNLVEPIKKEYEQI